MRHLQAEIYRLESILKRVIEDKDYQYKEETLTLLTDEIMDLTEELHDKDRRD